jgi:hypothetical protein
LLRIVEKQSLRFAQDYVGQFRFVLSQV